MSSAGLEIAYWNGDAGARWVASRERIDRQLGAITDALLAFAAPRAGERVVDVGCGCGTTTLELHRRTGAPVLAIDVSAAMLDVARARARGVDAIRFVDADAATFAFAPDHALVFSRFGVMFFADPRAAFANLRAALAPGGRLAFACWRAAELNPWATTPVAAAQALIPPEPPADPLAPGPFAFADGERVRDVLVRAGFRDITVTAHASTTYLGDTVADAVEGTLAIGPLARRAAALDDRARANIRELVAAALAPIATPAVAMPAAVWLVGARV